MPEPDDLGVLVVHGIGSQKRGDTLQGVGEPIVQSVKDWLGAGAVVAERNPDGPARLTVTRDGVTKSVVIAESWWEETFEPPGWWPFVKWLLWSIPFVVFRATDHGISVIDTNEKLDYAWSIRSWPKTLVYELVRIAKNALSVAIVLVLTVVLALVGVLALVPYFRSAMLSSQRLLLRYIGDSYHLLQGDVSANAPVSKVENDLHDLERRATRVAIVAHSQGAELARRVLARRQPAGPPIATLITFGSGIAKLRAVDRLHKRAWKAAGAYLLRVVAAAATVGAPLAVVVWDWPTLVDVGVVLVAVLVAGILLHVARRSLREIVESDLLAGELEEAITRERLERWLDLYATSDPVPEGALPVQRLKETLVAADSIRIANRRSPVRDHTTYAQNGEAFRSAVVAELADVAGWKLSEPAMAVVGSARAVRERSTRRLLAWRLLIWALVLAALALAVFDADRGVSDDVAEWLGERAGATDVVLGDDVADWLEGDPGRHVLAGVALVLAGWLVYALGAWLWGGRATARGRRLFDPSKPCGTQAVLDTTPFLLRRANALAARHADRVDRRRGWPAYPWHLPWLVPRFRGGIVLYGLRVRLRQYNLYDTPAVDPPTRARFVPRVLARTVNGRDTDLVDSEMGAVDTHFGRNGPAFRHDSWPSAQRVSAELLARGDRFLPAKTLNLLAASWIQFEVHDWMQHRPVPDWRERRNPAGGPLARDTPALQQTDETRPGAPRFASHQTHWWDASQLYGAHEDFTESLRTDDGEVLTGDPLLEVIEAGIAEVPAPVPNLWLGLALLHELFAREHNRICRLLRESDRGLDDDGLFNKARLINAALMAKIHTVEWTPAVIAHPTSEHAIHATWWGVLKEPFRRHVGRIGSGEVLSGIPGSRTHHDGVRYSLTEEFVAVYRMHPLIPDEVRICDHDSGLPKRTVSFEDLTATPWERGRPRGQLDQTGYEDAFYSLGIGHPGEISLHNYPEFLRKLPHPDRHDLEQPGPPLDLAARDIERAREAALPGYNDFRRVFRLAPKTTFPELAGGNLELADELEGVYQDVEDVDLMVGLFAEPKPEGFAFSDTAFRVFLLMAARRLRSDRFFTTDFNPAVYTPEGFKWVLSRTMTDMLAEHFPELGKVLAGVRNPFTPWPRVF
jgi:Animal haem peroxidase